MAEHFKDLALAAPSVSVGTLTLWGVPLAQWVLVLTAVYTVFLIIDKLPAVWRVLCALYRWGKKHVQGN
jgi:cytochrome c-type biogenesis protein CcmH/NrfF